MVCLFTCGTSLSPCPVFMMCSSLGPRKGQGKEQGAGAGEGAGSGAGEGAGGAKGGGGARVVECAASAMAPRALSPDSSEIASSADCSVADSARCQQSPVPSQQSPVRSQQSPTLCSSQHLGPTTAQSAVQPRGPSPRPRGQAAPEGGGPRNRPMGGPAAGGANRRPRRGAGEGRSGRQPKCRGSRILVCCSCCSFGCWLQAVAVAAGGGHWREQGAGSHLKWSLGHQRE